LHASSTQTSYFEKGHLTSPMPKDFSSVWSKTRKSGLAPNQGNSMLTTKPHFEHTLIPRPSLLLNLQYSIIAFPSLSFPHWQGSGHLACLDWFWILFNNDVGKIVFLLLTILHRNLTKRVSYCHSSNHLSLEHWSLVFFQSGVFLNA
jgi:hypothetical protein